MTKPRLTFDEHVEMGRALYRIREELMARCVQLGNAYPRSGPESVSLRKLNAVLDALDDARSALENALFRDHPRDAETSVYYSAAHDD
jgi:hypothetical protein